MGEGFIIFILVASIIVGIIAELFDRAEKKEEHKHERTVKKAELEAENKMLKQKLKVVKELTEKEQDADLLKFAVENQLRSEHQQRNGPLECRHCGAPVNPSDHGVCPYCGCQTGVTDTAHQFAKIIQKRIFGRKK